MTVSQNKTRIMNIMKGILIVTSIIFLFFLTGFYSNNKQEIKDVQNEEYKIAVIIAEQLLPEIKLKRENYKIVTIENMIISGDKFEGSDIWKITLKSKSLFGEDGELTGKGGEVYIKVDLKLNKASLLGYGE